jgi:hypothetical protein
MSDDYTATDILEACGLEPSGAPRVVVVAAELLALCQRGRRLIVCAYFVRMPRDFAWPFEGDIDVSDWPWTGWDHAVNRWGEVMGEELGIQWRVTMKVHRVRLGDGPRFEWRYATEPRRGEWRTLDIFETSEDAREWWKDCTYPLKHEQAADLGA